MRAFTKLQALNGQEGSVQGLCAFNMARFIPLLQIRNWPGGSSVAEFGIPPNSITSYGSHHHLGWI